MVDSVGWFIDCLAQHSVPVGYQPKLVAQRGSQMFSIKTWEPAHKSGIKMKLRFIQQDN